MFDKDRLSCLMRISTLIICLLLGTFIFTNRFTFKEVIQENVFPVVADVFYGASEQELISITLERMMDKNIQITSAVVYGFIPDEKTAIYKNQKVIATQSRFDLYGPPIGLLEDISTNRNVQNILLNKIQYDNTKTIQILCESLFDINHVYSCDKYKTIGLSNKSVVSIPVLDTNTYGVLGYVVITLDDEYSNIDIQNLVNNSKPYIQRLEKIIKHRR